MCFDSIIKAICPNCEKDMEYCNVRKATYCQWCDFSFEYDDPCKNCEYYVSSLQMCKNKDGGFKKIENI